MKVFSGYKNACWLVANLALLLSLSTGMAHAEQKPPLFSLSQNHSVGLPMMVATNGMLLLQIARKPVARSAAQSVMDSLPRPDKVTGVKVSYKNGGLKVTWNPVTIHGKPASHAHESNLRYEVFRCADQTVSSCPSEGQQNSVNGNHVWPTSLAFTDRTVPEKGVWYYYRVRACTVLCSRLSDVARGAMMTYPSDITASMGTYEDKVHISWSPVPIADRYIVSRCMRRRGICSEIALQLTTTSFDDRHAPGGVTVYYKIWACNKEAGCFATPTTEYAAGMKKKLQVVWDMRVSNPTYFYHRDYISIVSAPPKPEGVLAQDPVTQIYRCESYNVRNVIRKCKHIADGNYVFDRSAVPGRYYYYVARYCGGGTCGDFQRHPDGSISIYEGKRNPLPMGAGQRPDPPPPPRP